MTYAVSILERIIILRINGRFVGAYDNMDQVDRVIDAYKGRSVR